MHLYWDSNFFYAAVIYLFNFFILPYRPKNTPELSGIHWIHQPPIFVSSTQVQGRPVKFSKSGLKIDLWGIGKPTRNERQTLQSLALKQPLGKGPLPSFSDTLMHGCSVPPCDKEGRREVNSMLTTVCRTQLLLLQAKWREVGCMFEKRWRELCGNESIRGSNEGIFSDPLDWLREIISKISNRFQVNPKWACSFPPCTNRPEYA